MSEMTHVLSALGHSPSAAEQLLPLVYEELRKLAARHPAKESPGQTLQATALVHEAYLRLVGPDGRAVWDNRGHFFAAAAESVRRILVDHARRKQSQKRGGGRLRVGMDDLAIELPEAGDDVVALDEALTRLAGTDAQAAEVLGVSPRSAVGLYSGLAPPRAGLRRRRLKSRFRANPTTPGAAAAFPRTEGWRRPRPSHGEP
jgi:RNA polymerase sigma factor (TIGR02999 family)